MPCREDDEGRRWWLHGSPGRRGIARRNFRDHRTPGHHDWRSHYLWRCGRALLPLMGMVLCLRRHWVLRTSLPRDHKNDRERRIGVSADPRAYWGVLTARTMRNVVEDLDASRRLIGRRSPLERWRRRRYETRVMKNVDEPRRLSLDPSSPNHLYAASSNDIIRMPVFESGKTDIVIRGRRRRATDGVLVDLFRITLR